MQTPFNTSLWLIGCKVRNKCYFIMTFTSYILECKYYFFRQVRLPLLQSHFAHVERSKLDQRYADYEQGERMQLDDVPEDLEAAEEKDCPDVHSVFARAHGTGQRSYHRVIFLFFYYSVHGASFMANLIFFCRSTAFVRFDSTSEEHTKSYSF